MFGLAVRTASLVGKRKCITKIQKRYSHQYYYRTLPKAPKSHETVAEVFGAFMWWWIFWHIFTEPEHLFGEFPFVKPEEWTDEELGIPPDDVD